MVTQIRFSAPERRELARAIAAPQDPWLVAVDRGGTATLRWCPADERQYMHPSLVLLAPTTFAGDPAEVELDGRRVPVVYE